MGHLCPDDISEFLGCEVKYRGETETVGKFLVVEYHNLLCVDVGE